MAGYVLKYWYIPPAILPFLSLPLYTQLLILHFLLLRRNSWWKSRGWGWGEDICRYWISKDLGNLGEIKALGHREHACENTRCDKESVPPPRTEERFFFCLVKVGLRVVREIVRRAQMWWSETWTLHPDCLHPLPSMPCSRGGVTVTLHGLGRRVDLCLIFRVKVSLLMTQEYVCESSETASPRSLSPSTVQAVEWFLKGHEEHTKVRKSLSPAPGASSGPVSHRYSPAAMIEEQLRWVLHGLTNEGQGKCTSGGQPC